MKKTQKSEKRKCIFTKCLCTLFFLMLLGVCSQTLRGNSAETHTVLQKKGKRVTGVVRDATDKGSLPGVTISIEKSTRGVITDVDGTFSIEDVPEDGNLVVSLIGYQTQTISVKGANSFEIELKLNENELDEVTIVAFGKQKKESVIASVSTVNVKDLKTPSSNLTTSFAGRIAGLISYQRSGEPGADDAEFFIRGITTFGTGKANPLILIDGVESTQSQLARLTADNIASFSVMKDANATALYGARGANGVILVNTKEGAEGKTVVTFRAELSMSSPTKTVDVSDPITFMRLQNEATRTRNPLAGLPFSQEKIYNTERGIDPLMYPAIDWHDYLIKDNTMNQRYNFTISGGGTAARYFVGGAYSRDEGIFKENKNNNFNNNSIVDRYNLFSNVNMNLTKTTEAIIRLSGTFDESKGPLTGGNDMFINTRNATPVLFHPYYEPDERTKHLNHILFGNAGSTGNYLNPYAELVKGYKKTSYSVMSAQLELKQKLDMITPGLFARAMFNIKRTSNYTYGRAMKPYWYKYSTDPATGEGMLTSLNKDGQEFLSFEPGIKEVFSQLYVESAVQYNRKFEDKHNLGALLVGTISENVNGNAEATSQNLRLLASLPSRNIGLAGRLSYDYDSRYFIEGNFGYNGSERFSKSQRWGFFPSVGAGWILSNEPFWSKDIAKIIQKVKLKGTYGLVGNDQIGDINDRFFYISQVELSSGNLYSPPGYTFGSMWGNPIPGINILRYGDPNITWEVSRKLNLGLELNLLGKLEIQVDYYRELRSKILQYRSYIPPTMGLQSTPTANIGKAKGEGMEIMIDYNHAFNNDFWITARGNFTYSVSKFDKYEEPDYSEIAPWKTMTGQKINQMYGYVAERLFVDDEEVKNSPVQSFGDYMAGDIKYKDINGDGKISELDMVPIGYPTVPEIIYGFGASVGYKGFDFSFFMQGSARSSFLIDASTTQPFVDGTRAILKDYANDHWSEDNRNSYALWPRLSTTPVENNTQPSTWWLRDGSFIRLKTVEVGYSFPKKIISKLHMSRLRVYATGDNLAVFSPFKMWDPEMSGWWPGSKGNGLGYPLQRIINLGINIEF